VGVYEAAADRTWLRCAVRGREGPVQLEADILDSARSIAGLGPAAESK
jgi:hypothetical protein